MPTLKPVWVHGTDVARSIGKGPRDIWDLKLLGLGKNVMTKERFVYLHGEGKKLCRLIAGGISIYIPCCSTT